MTEIMRIKILTRYGLRVIEAGEGGGTIAFLNRPRDSVKTVVCVRGGTARAASGTVVETVTRRSRSGEQAERSCL